MQRRKKAVGIIVPILIAIVFIALYLCNEAVQNAAKGKLYTTVASTPYNKVGLLLGTSKWSAHSNENLYYRYRIDAAIALLKNGKIKYIIISGDNSRKNYNEPEMMRQDLITAGIDSNLIFLDYAGFRTFDSIVRLKAIFGQHTATIISQQFHNERALFIASKENINAIGFNATDVSNQYGFKTQLREKLARVKVYLDYLFGKEPKFLGPSIAIPQA